MTLTATDCIITGERALPGVFDTERARAGGVFELAHATWGGRGVDADLMRMRLRDIDAVIMEGTREGLLVNDPNHRPPSKMAYVPSRMPVAGSTPDGSAAWDGSRWESYPLGDRPGALQWEIDDRNSRRA